jgi:polysaccharide pyruvyl transferase WcaK-like protein
MNSKKPLNLIHLANFNSTNIGNGALINGLESTVEEDFSAPVNWLREPWDDYTFRLRDFDQAFVDKVNASDGLIVGGAVTFNGRNYNDRTGSRFELPFELWPQIRKPVVFYGLSYRHWPGQTYHHADKLKMTIEKILSSPNMMLTVRNDGTKNWLKDVTGIDSEGIIEIPDSAVFVRAAKDEHIEIRQGVRNIMVAFNDEDSAHRFDESYSVAGQSNRSRDHVVNALIGALERLAERFPLNLILCPHYFDDYKMMSTFIERIRPRLAHQQMVSTGLSRVEHVGAFYGRYRKADLAISMRVHSMSPCVGLGTPMVAFTTQDRMTDFMDRIGLNEQSVDAFGLSAADRLYERAVFTLENGAQVRERLLSARQALREEARRLHGHLFEFLAA